MINYETTVKTFISDMIEEKETIRYCKMTELAREIHTLHKGKDLSFIIYFHIKDCIMNKPYTTFSAYLKYEKYLRQKIILLCKIFFPLKRLNFYKKFKKAFKKYSKKNLESIQQAVLNYDKRDMIFIKKVFKRYGLYKKIFDYVKEKTIATYLTKIKTAKSKEEEIAMVEQIVDKRNQFLLDSEEINRAFLNIYVEQFDDIYEISLTPKIQNLGCLFAQSDLFESFRTKLEKCYNQNISFAYIMNVHICYTVEMVFATVMNKNERLITDNVHLLKDMPKKNLDFIIKNLVQSDLFERNYRLHISNRILRQENLDDEMDVYFKEYNPNVHNLSVDIATCRKLIYDIPTLNSGTEEETTNTNKTLNQVGQLRVIDIPEKGKYILRNQIFRKIFHLIENIKNPVLDFRWPKYAELTFNLPTSVSRNKKINQTVSTMKIKLLGHDLICTAFQYVILDYICKNYKNTALIKKIIKKTKFENIEDQRSFFGGFLKNKSEESVFNDHIDPICKILQPDLSLKIESDLNLCPEKFRLFSDKITGNVKQNTEAVLDAFIIKTVKKEKECDIKQLYGKYSEAQILSRVESLVQKGYCTKNGEKIVYCP